MGTNFYWLVAPDGRLPTGDMVEHAWQDMDPRVHIGKRSAAGKYCYDCKRTLCKTGPDRVHEGDPFYDHCPTCGQTADPDSYNTVKVELGFSKAATERPTGVAGASSFTWAQAKALVVHICLERGNLPLIEDEYRRHYSGAEFLELLAAGCPIEFMRVGKWFS